jgi:hypothetical protein
MNRPDAGKRIFLPTDPGGNRIAYATATRPIDVHDAYQRTRSGMHRSLACRQAARSARQSAPAISNSRQTAGRRS